MDFGEGQETLRVAIEGNIGAGKSTLIDRLVELPWAYAFDEPVEAWRHITFPVQSPWAQCVLDVLRKEQKSLETFNLMAMYYADQPKFSYPFQNQVLLTRIQQARDAQRLPRPVCFLGRSWLSNFSVFGRLLLHNGCMSEVELTLQAEMLNMLQPPAINGVIYMRIDPDEAWARKNQRARPEERGVAPDYFHHIHTYHEDWLMATPPLPTLVLDASTIDLRSDAGFQTVLDNKILPFLKSLRN